ncbi:germinal-center associated nuclear protein-like [Saccostrea echinata]|uniref:germinal-center associated nuclear protein-like n=1 Tax=Saccostrea echinata TaxID=191078 RepID=UPI002A7F56A4|nr:germinal-center associated nuclear protein-like [Saccostrea echinata]
MIFVYKLKGSLFGSTSTFGASSTKGNGNQPTSTSGNTLASDPKPGLFGPIGAFPSQTTGNAGSSNSGTAFQGSKSTASSVGKSSTGSDVFGSGSVPFGGTSSTPSGAFGGPPTTGSRLFGTSTQTADAVPQGGALFKSTAQTNQTGHLFGASASGTSALFHQKPHGESQQLFGKPVPASSSLVGGESSSKAFGSGGSSEDGNKGPVSLRDKSSGEIKELSPPASMFILKGSTSKTIQSTAATEVGVDTVSSKSKKNLFSKAANMGPKPGGAQTLFGKAIASTQQMTWRRGAEGEEGRKMKRRSSDETEEETHAKRATSTRRLSSVEDRVALICKNVPPRFNSGQKLRQHFTKFGEVTRVITKPDKGMATIHFKTHEAALEAKRKGAVIMKGEKRMEIFWSSFSPAAKGLGRKSSTEDASTPQGPLKRHAQVKAGASQFKWRRNDVDEELASMSGTSDISGQKQQVMSLPDEVKGQQSQSTERAMRHASPVPSGTSSSPAIPTKIDKGAVISLRNSIARNNSDRLQILNLRDKVNRLGPKKQSDLATARAFVGTCTDMCPEKERYDREEKRRLHPYEVLQTSEGSGNPQVNHTLAVKEYSRSSADQEEPLPYELRTLPTLTLTMTYLLREIADRGEDGKWGDWFDFLWNRTRGIRKEITQQQFCNVESVELLEKCVRFHIFCAERLCEEDMHSFDDKINNENMTKCLQTLKENYSDLEKKQVFCANEAEMRCYMVLMNLNEGDILRETQQLRPEVRNSTLINYALKVYAALNSNNYVRFFRLVREGSFLCSCILHRYFTQVRKKALHILVKAHRKGVQLPLEDLVRTLSFDDQSEAAQFCQFFGLTTVDNCVTLDKAAFIEPEENWCPRRSTIIERKRSTSVGEAIYGGPLPTFSLPEPENSFDNNGKFIGQIIVKDSDFVDSPRKDAVRSYNVPDQISVSTDKMATPQPTVIPKIKVTYTNEEVKETAKFLFWEVIDNMCLEIGQETKHEVDNLMEISQSLYDSITGEVVAEFVSTLAKQAETEAELLRQKQQKAEKEAMITRSAVYLTSEILKEVLDQETLNLSTAEIREVHAELKRQRIQRCSAEIADVILNSTVQDITQSVSLEVYQKDVVERLQKLADLEHCVKVKRAGRYLRIWKAQHTAQIKFKRSLLDFPSSISMMDPAQQIETLIPDRRVEDIQEGGFYVNQTTKLSVESPVMFVKRSQVEDKVLTAHEIYRNLCRQKAWKPLDICSLGGRHLLVKNRVSCKKNTKCSQVFWKLVISLPDPDYIQTDHQGQSLSHLAKWLKAKFSRGTSKPHHHSSVQNELLSLYTVPITYESMSGSLGVCVRLLEGNISIHDVPGSLLGTSCLLFVMPPPLVEDPEWLLWEEEKKRLEDLLMSKPNSPALPLVVLCPVPANENVDEDFIWRCLNIDELVEDGKISDISLCVVKYDDDFPKGVDVEELEVTEKLSESVRWLMEHSPEPPGLRVQHCRAVVEDFIQDQFYRPVLYNLKQRKLSGYLHQDPNTIITLYNAVIVYLQQVLTSPELLSYSWPVSEFTHSKMHDLPPLYWNTDKHMTLVSDLLDDLQLPSFTYSVEEDDDWSTVCRDVWAFVQRITDGFPPSQCVDLTSKVRVLLRQTRLDFEDTCDLCTGVSQCNPTYINMPWTDVLMACVEFKITVADFTDLNSESGLEEILLAYNKDALLDFDPPVEWRYLEDERDREGNVSLEKTFYRAAAKELARRRILRNLKTGPSSVTQKEKSNTVDPLPQTVCEAKQSSDLLSTTIEEEKLKSQKFDKYLENLVNGTDMDQTASLDVTNMPLWSMYESVEEVSVMSKNSLRDSMYDPEVSVSFADSVNDSEVSVWRYGRYNLDKTLNQPRISEQFEKLEEDLKSHRRASDVFELQLQRWIQEGV